VRAHIRSYVSPIARAWLLAHPSTSSAHFLPTLCICLGISHRTIPHFSWCQCDHTINDLGIHLLHCLCGGEDTTIHDTFWNTIATIMLESGAHIQREVSHLFLRHTWKRVDIVITKNKFWTLADVVIVDPTHTGLVH